MGGTATVTNKPIGIADSSISYGAEIFRRYITPHHTEGVLAHGDGLVSERAAGANMSVDVAAATGVLIQGDTDSNEGMYFGEWDSVQNVSITAADGSNPRIDRIVAEIKNDDVDSSGTNALQIRAVDGTPSAGASLSNLTGVASLPSSAVNLGFVLVAAGDTSISDSEISSVVGYDVTGSGDISRHYSSPREWAIGSFTSPGSTGNSSVTGVGFTPSRVEFHYSYSGTGVGMGSGVVDIEGNEYHTYIVTNATNAYRSVADSNCIRAKNSSNTDRDVAAWVSMDSDGFTLNWTTANAETSVKWKAYR